MVADDSELAAAKALAESHSRNWHLLSIAMKQRYLQDVRAVKSALERHQASKT